MSFLPVALAAGSAVAGLAGSYVSAEGQATQAAATSEAASYQAQVAANNAIIANQNADYSVSAGQAKSADVSMAGAENVAKIKNATATNGVNVNTGSAADVQQSSREVNTLNAERTLSDAQLKAYGYRTQAANFEAESNLQKMKAQSAIEGGNLASEGTILSGISGVAGKWTTGGGFGSGSSGGGIGTFSNGGNDGAAPTWG